MHTLTLITLLFASLAHTATVRVSVGPNESMTFVPEKITVNVGDTVDFFFEPGTHTHSVVHGTSCTAAPNPLFNLRESGVFTFTQVGEFPYFCDIGSHCAAGMVGVVTVVDLAVNSSVGGTARSDGSVGGAAVNGTSEVPTTPTTLAPQTPSAVPTPAPRTSNGVITSVGVVFSAGLLTACLL